MSVSAAISALENAFAMFDRQVLEQSAALQVLKDDCAQIEQHVQSVGRHSERFHNLALEYETIRAEAEKNAAVAQAA